MQGYTFNFRRGIAALVVAMVIVEALDDDDEAAEDEFGQGGVVGSLTDGTVVGEYFSGDLA